METGNRVSIIVPSGNVTLAEIEQVLLEKGFNMMLLCRSDLFLLYNNRACVVCLETNPEGEQFISIRPIRVSYDFEEISLVIDTIIEWCQRTHDASTAFNPVAGVAQSA